MYYSSSQPFQWNGTAAGLGDHTLLPMIELFITLNDPLAATSPPPRLMLSAPSYRPENWAIILVSCVQLIIGLAGVLLGYETAVHLHQSCRKRIVNVFVEWLCYTRWVFIPLFSVDCMHFGV